VRFNAEMSDDRFLAGHMLGFGVGNRLALDATIRVPSRCCARWRAALVQAG